MTRAIALGLVLCGAAFAQGKPAAKAEPAKAEPAKAEAGKPMEMPKPSEEITKETKFWQGKWSCTGKMMASPMGPEHPVMTTLDFKSVLGGFWIQMNFEEKKTKENPMAMTGVMMAGWDPVKKMLARVDYLSSGGWAMFTSKGWEGDKEVWAGDGMMMGKMMKVQHTFTKKSDTQVTMVMEAAGPDGKMMPMFEDDCKKGGKK
jgi:hypothetical protein